MAKLEPPYGIQRLHHFTDSRNLVSIREHGLLSRLECGQRGVTSITGGDERSRELDAAYGLDAYVHLSLTPYHPMQYVAVDDGRIYESVDVIVSPEVLTLPGIMMTLDIANKLGGDPLLPIDGWIQSVELSLIYRSLSVLTPRQHQRVKELRKIEVLVPNSVAPHFLYFNVHRRSRNS